MSQITLDDINPRYLWLDPASGKKKEAIKNVRARSAIVVAGVDSLNHIYILDAWADRVGTNEIVAQFVNMCEQWQPQIAAFEAMGQQSLLTDPILNEANRRGLSIPLSAVTVSTKVDKRFRIRASIQPMYGAGRLIINEDLIELINEVTTFPMSSTMDLVDAMASVIGLIPPQVSNEKAHDDAAELAAYLRASGVPMADIEKRVAEVSGSAVGKGSDSSWMTLKKLWKKEK